MPQRRTSEARYSPSTTARLLRCVVIFCASLPGWLAAAPPPEMKPAIDLMARAIAAETPTIVLGTIANDDFWRVPETDFVPREGTFEDIGSILMSLNLTRVYVQQVLRSDKPVPKIIYLQKPIPGGVIVEGVRPWPPALFPDGRARLLFLVEPKQVVTGAVGLQGSRAQKTISENKDKLPPLELFKLLGIDRYVRAGSYFEPFERQASILVEEAPAVLAAIKLPAAAEASLRQRPDVLTRAGTVFPKGFAKDVGRLLDDRKRRQAPRPAAETTTPSRSRKPIALETEPGRWLQGALESSRPGEREPFRRTPSN